MQIHAVVPVKTLALAKSRLAGALTPAERQALVREMLGRVLATLARAQVHAPAALAATWIVSADPDLRAFGVARGARPLGDLAGSLNGALEYARTMLTGAGAAAMLVLPADVPLVTLADICDMRALLRAGADVALAADHGGSGTNALALRLPSALPFTFGPDSAAQHSAAAAAYGLRLSRYQSTTLALDIDDLPSLARYHADASRPATASCT